MSFFDKLAQSAKLIQNTAKAAAIQRQRSTRVRQYVAARNPFGAEVPAIDAWKNVTLSIGGANPVEAVKVWQTIIGVTPIDGVFGPLTLAKTKAWQADHALPQDGVVGPLTWTAASRTVVTGSALEVVKQWQRVIGVTPIDGVFGPITQQKTKDWQAVHGITPDGIVGPLTWVAAGLSQLNPILSMGGVVIQPSGPVPGVVTTPGVAQTGTGTGTGKFEGTYAEAVKVWQQHLNLKADGIFGINTLSATKGFQQSKGITTDGVVGPLTWQAAGITRIMPVLTAKEGTPAAPLPKPGASGTTTGTSATTKPLVSQVASGISMKEGVGIAAGVGLVGYVIYKLFGKKKA